MFSLIFYSGLITSVASAHFNNDTSMSKDCVLDMKENEISQIVELFNSNRVNPVVIYVLFAHTSGLNHWLSRGFRFKNVLVPCVFIWHF